MHIEEQAEDARNVADRSGAWSRRQVGLRLARAASRVRVDLPLVALDVFLIGASYTIVLLARFEGRVPGVWWDRFLVFLPVAMLVTVAATAVCGGYGRWWRHASIDEARRLILAAALSLVVLLATFTWGGQLMPLSLLVGGPLLSVALAGVVRFQSRLFAFYRNQDEPAGGLRTVVVGAGKTGSAALREMRQNRRLGFDPVAVLDDNPAMHRRSLFGVPVVGSVDKLRELLRDRDVDLVLLAITDRTPEVARRVADAAAASDVPIRLVRGAEYWVHGAPLQELRALRIEDLLGRGEVEVDVEPLHSLFEGRRVLVTGGGGWIGKEIARQVTELDPGALALLDHDETHLHDAAFDAPAAQQCLVDVRDAKRVDALFDEFRPEIVFHAAAHKHVPILESHACEAVRTNVLGTLNVVNASVRTGVQRFVGISTDKAAQPTNVMGASKWLAEQIVLSRAPAGAIFCAVRFGNVLGSRGSVIPTFQRQIEDGGPVTVTDPEMTRFFMSVDEAVRLVLLATSVASGSELLALDMGEKVNILELAQRMIRLSGRRVGHDIEIAVIGARPGENAEESVVGAAERVRSYADVPIVEIEPVRLGASALSRVLEQLGTAAATGNDDAARALLLDVASAAARARPA